MVTRTPNVWAQKPVCAGAQASPGDEAGCPRVPLPALRLSRKGSPRQRGVCVHTAGRHPSCLHAGAWDRRTGGYGGGPLLLSRGGSAVRTGKHSSSVSRLYPVGHKHLMSPYGPRSGEQLSLSFVSLNSFIGICVSMLLALGSSFDSCWKRGVPLPPTICPASPPTSSQHYGAAVGHIPFGAELAVNCTPFSYLRDCFPWA